MKIDVQFEELQELKPTMDAEGQEISLTSTIDTIEPEFEKQKKELEAEFSEARENMDTSSLLVQAFKGNDGYSAYEIACQNGFVGTEEEWLDSLRGKDGDMQKSVYDSQGKNVDFYRYAEGLVEDLANKNHVHNADDVTFDDGETFQQKYDSGELRGQDGVIGKDGKDGRDGYTPIKGVDYFDGEDGSDGVSCTHSWNGTTLTINSASGSSSADLKGDKGDRGEKGEIGLYYGDEEAESTIPLNADTLGGQLPDYYAKASDLAKINKKLWLGSPNTLGENTLSDYLSNYEEVLVYSNFYDGYSTTYVLGSIKLYTEEATRSDLKFIICMNDGTIRKTQFYFSDNKIYVDKLDNVTSLSVYGITKKGN